MTMSTASAKHQHRGGGGQQSSPCPASSARSIHSHVQDVVSVTRERFNDVVSSLQSRQGIVEPQSPSPSGVSLVGLRHGLDAIVKVMFAPCVNMDIGGVPREEMPATAPCAMASVGRAPAPLGTLVTPPWGASIPFEVSASSILSGSLVQSQSSNHDLSPAGHAQLTPRHPQLQQQQARQHQQARPASAREARMAESQALLRQLGARHQLAGGFSGESLANTARPIHPADDVREEDLRRGATASSPELVDFDDGISAISSHTLEEMERRLAAKDKKAGGGGRTGITMRVNPHDFTHVIEEGCEWGGSGSGGVQGGAEGDGWRQWGGGTLDLVEEVEEKNTEVVFGDPFYEEGAERGQTPRDNVADPHKKTDTNRVASNLTMTTTGTDDSHEFEELYRRQEALYWQDQDRVADAERRSRSMTRNHDATARSSHQRMSIEERARRLREISRSRSRSDGTNSSCVVSRHPSVHAPMSL
jgi:hypothetical protein